MTTIALNGSDSETHSTWTDLVTRLSEYRAGARDGQEIEARVRMYSRMSNPELAELGLKRADIYRAALLGRPV